MLLGYFLRVFAILSKRRFFHPLNWNDDLKESGVGVIGILGVGVGILGKLGVGVGPYTFRLRNPAKNNDKENRKRISKLKLPRPH